MVTATVITADRKITYIDPEKLEDNPFQPRHYYNPTDIQELADSIEEHGLRQLPEAREKDGKIQIAYGHKRKRAFIKLKKKYPHNEGWQTIPVEIKEISDDEMFYFAMEENLRRGDITPMDTARGIDHFLNTFPNKKEQEVADKLKMTQGNVSNMRRVLRLPKDILAKVDEGKINFTMARELLILEGVNGLGVSETMDDRGMMLEAIRGIGGYYYPSTVDGLKKSIASVASRYLFALEKESSGYGSYKDPFFDTREAGCLKCKDMIKVYPTKSQARHYCTNKECWTGKQQAHKDEQARKAKERMATDILQKIGKVEGKRVKGKDISQEISEVEESSEGILGEEELEAILDQNEQDEEEAASRHRRSRPGHDLCQECLNGTKCDGTGVYLADNSGSGVHACDSRVTKETFKDVTSQATIEIPDHLKDLVSAAAGTRGQILDLDQLRVGSYYTNELKAGHVNITSSLESMENPKECLERCTTGFHYAYDARLGSGETSYVCTNPKCASKKKAAFTRAKNAQGQARKKAEMKAIKEAVEKTTATLDKARLKLLVMVQLEKIRTSYWDREYFSPIDFWFKKLDMKRTNTSGEFESVYKALDAIDEQDLAQMVIESMLMCLTSGTGKDMQHYKIQTTQPLNWMGISPKVEKVATPAKTKKEK